MIRVIGANVHRDVVMMYKNYDCCTSYTESEKLKKHVLNLIFFYFGLIRYTFWRDSLMHKNAKTEKAIRIKIKERVL